MSIGVDLVHLPTFAKQLEVTGSRLSQPGAVFTARELRRAEARADLKGDSIATHLGAVWALKEAVIKAWGAAVEERGDQPPLTVDDIEWSQLQVHHSKTGAPILRVVGQMRDVMDASLGEDVRWNLSASHDGDYAVGMAFLMTEL